MPDPVRMRPTGAFRLSQLMLLHCGLRMLSGTSAKPSTIICPLTVLVNTFGSYSTDCLLVGVVCLVAHDAVRWADTQHASCKLLY
jgi:hypothetical protein